MPLHFSLEFPYAYEKPDASGDFRTIPEDFCVDENLGFEPEGAGEHVYLHLRKRGENTAWLAEQIARLAQVKPHDVSYAGRKDRHAVTTQWFSVYLPKKEEPDWNNLNTESVLLLARQRHTHKLRKGEHEENHFIIRLRNIDGPAAFIESRLEKIVSQGVPNYFGEQRFGHNGNNLHHAHELLVDNKNIRDKQKRGLMLSAARSWLFNQVLAERVRQYNWQVCLDGEPQGSPSGPLWGRGRSTAQADTLNIENDVLNEWASWRDGLEHVGLQQERRSLILSPQRFKWRWVTETDLEVSFSLGSGEFATSVLREIIQTKSSAPESTT